MCRGGWCEDGVVFEADFSRTQRRALLDSTAADVVVFARRTIDWAALHGHAEIVWHFAGVDSVSYLRRARELRGLAASLKRSHEATVDGVRIVLSTRRLRSNSLAPLAAWWPDDGQLLSLDSTLRPLVDAFLSDPSRAPIWLTAFDVGIAGEVGVADPRYHAGHAAPVSPIVVSSALQEAVTTYSRPMTLSSNGVHDSLAPALLSAARRMLRDGQATREAVAVAALRAGWWPEKIPALLRSLGA